MTCPAPAAARYVSRHGTTEARALILLAREGAQNVELILFFLLVCVVGLTAAARVSGLPYPILLVIGGSLVGFTPGMPDVALDPDLVLLVFLPPLLFNTAYFSSVRDLRANARAITLTAVGLVVLTTALVGVVVHAAVDGLPWAVAFVLGAIVSPTDPLAAVAITRRVGIPSRLTAVIEGESLINDGSALVIYRTAVAAAVGGTFDAVGALGEFAVSVAGGIAVGLVAAALLTRLLRLLVGDGLLGLVVSLVCGYAAYLPAEELGVSGVLAAVVVGLVVGRRSPNLSTAAGRLRGYAFWEVLVFLLNAFLFVLVGLQLPGVLASQDRSALTLAGLALAVIAAVFGARLLWLNTIPYLIRAIDRRPSQRARRAGWRERLVAVWSGMRGAVSLAAALALPADFPERDLLVFLTLAVIFATLVGQGLTLEPLVRRLGVEEDDVNAREELHARTQATDTALAQLRDLPADPRIREDTVERMRGLYEFRRRRLAQRADGVGDDEEDVEARSRDYQRLVREVLDAQRERLIALRDEGEISDAVMHRLVRELDLEEQRLDA